MSNLTSAGSSGPAVNIAAVTPSDVADLPGGACRGFYVGGAGAVRVRAPGGGEATILSGAGQYHPVRATRILAAGTDATGIVALY